MKRLLLTLATAAALVGPMAAAGAASADPRDWDRGHDNGRHQGWDRRDHDDRRGGWDRGRSGDWDRRRWDDRAHNGYYYQNRWYYGPPPVAYYGRPDYRPGYMAWRRGAYLPPPYRGYVVQDYYRYHLRPPPRGYYWYRVGNDYLLAAIATGLIFDVIANN